METKTSGVPLREKLAYSLGMLGTNVTYGLTTGYLLIYYTDVYRIPAVAISVLFLIARIWDAVNDPLMGVIADRTHTRMGKFRPYILISGLLMAVFTSMLFFTPDIGVGAKIAFAYVAYIGWDMSYTMSDVPKWSMTSVMTSDKEERVSLISWAKIFGMVGNIGANIAIIPLVHFFAARFPINGEPSQAMGYRYMAIALSVVVLLASVLMFAGTKERIRFDGQKAEQHGGGWRSVFSNKPLLLLLASLLVINVIFAVNSALQIHYVKYNLGNEGLVPVIMAIVIVPTLVGAGLSGMLIKKFGKKKLFIAAMVVFMLRGVIHYFVGYGNLVAVIALMSVMGVCTGIFNVVQIAMLTDTIDHAERMTGTRNEGTIFSTQTFVVKLAGAVGGSAAAMVLAFVGYQENAVQSVATLDGIHFCMTVLPAIAGILALLPIWFYKLGDETQSA